MVSGADWRAVVAAMQREEPVFVAGIPRSGTTALRASLERHPRFRSRFGELPGVETRIFARPETVLDVVEPRGERLFQYLAEDHAAAQQLAALLDAVRRDTPAAAQDAAVLARLFFHVAKRARGVERIVEKTPRHMEHVDAMLAAFPRAKVLLTLRHPVDVFSSFRKKVVKGEGRGADEERLDGWRVAPEEFCADFERWTRAIVDAEQRHPANVRVIDYDALTGEPERVLAEVCAFVGVPFEAAAMLDARDVKRDDFGSPRPNHRIAVNEKRWSDFVSPEEARFVEDRLAPWLARLGWSRK